MRSFFGTSTTTTSTTDRMVALTFVFTALLCLVQSGKAKIISEDVGGRRRRRENNNDDHNHNNSNDHSMSMAQSSFLFLLADDIGWSDVGYNGGTAATPNLDRWAAAAGSIKLQDFHSGGTVCSPTRATVLTGRHHFRDCVDKTYGCPDMSTCKVPKFQFAPSRTYTIGDAVRAAAGTTADDYKDGAYFAGKWHLGSFYNDSEAYGGVTSSPVTHGFHHYNATQVAVPTSTANCMCRSDWESHCNFGHYGGPNHCNPPGHCCFNYWWDDPMSAHGVTNLTRPTGTDDSLYLVDAFTRFLTDRHKRNKPFLAQISFHNCHNPFIGTKQATAACQAGKTCRPPNRGDPAYTAEEVDYYACVTELDHAVGLILTELRRLGYYDNTMIWFTSDNGPEELCPPAGICQRSDTRPQRPVEGPGSAGPLRGRKRDIYEGGHRVPAIVSYPAVIRAAEQEQEGKGNGGGGESWETVVTMDFLPTVMEILGADRPPWQQLWAMDGRSIMPLLRDHERFRWHDSSGGPRGIGIGFYDPILTKVHGWGYRYGPWKYVEGSKSCQLPACRKPQLYNLNTDLGERHDVSEHHPDILANLQNQFRTWHASVMKSRKEESKCRQRANSKYDDLNLPLSMLLMTHEQQQQQQ